MKPRKEHQIINGIECKYCTKCELFIDINDFAKNKNNWDGLHCFCFPCKRKLAKIYHSENSQIIIDKVKAYVDNNKDKVKEYQKEYRKENYSQLRMKRKIWERNNKDSRKEYKKNYERNMRKNTDYRLLANLRNRLGQAVRGKGTKSITTIQLIGCDISVLRTHLEKMFQPGMTWDNYGKWHIDHVIPCSAFDMSKSEEQKKCFHYTNLQPLWAIDNIRKGSKYTIPDK